VQVYTGFIYEGLGLVGQVTKHLSRMLDQHGLATIADAVGIEAKAWAAGEASLA